VTMDHHRQNIEIQGKNQNAPRPSYFRTISKMVNENGAKMLLRGVKCTMGREAINTLAWTLWTNRITNSLEPQIGNPLTAKIIGGVVSGILAAIISHPLDTMKVKIQNGMTTGFVHQKMLSAVRASYKTECEKSTAPQALAHVSRALSKEAFSGVAHRAGVLAIFITAVNISNSHYKKALETIVT